MEDIKKRPLSEEELEQVTGGVKYKIYGTDSASYGRWVCERCGQRFYHKEDAEFHEPICTGEPPERRKLKPVIL